MSHYFLISFLIVSLFISWLIIKHSRAFVRLVKSIFISSRKDIVANPDVMKMVSRHPHLFGFLKQRLNRKSFYGLPLTLLSLVLFYALLLFVGVIQDIITSDPLALTDVRIANLLYAFRNDEALSFFTWVTTLGSAPIIITSSIAFSIVLWIWKKHKYLLPFWLTLAGAQLFSSLGKVVIRRPRPELAFYNEHTFSFPSGHAALSVVFYGFIAYFLFRSIKKWEKKVAVLCAALFIISLIGFSRIYIGVHFLSDVWGGYLLGAIWLVIGITVSEIINRRNPVVSGELHWSVRETKAISIGLLTIGLLIYVVFAMYYRPLINNERVTEQIVVTNDIIKTLDEENLSRYSETLGGNNQEPLNIIITAKDDNELISVMRQAGWSLADPVTLPSLVAMAKAALYKENYSTAPMTPSFWNTRVHDFGFEKPTEAMSARERHHFRIWRTSIIMPNGYHVYVSTGSLDAGIYWFVAHRIAPDIDTERELLFNDLNSTGMVLNSDKIQLVAPTIGNNFIGNQFFTDGKTYLIALK
ncbi:MAG: hypothetical protein A3E61_01495 [Candidatus Colwellbacteria bacterium RIFCSPHIGHO2_12_FULL_43_12]|uniref:Phosphatidic acid phosphatase type 2/haloperoxidase domain-containing protein n=3 Tax=Candidatus Colwelliibacteriota TaxID=1817904 RepID=A0A1G1Z113_9BACT|nr:MAG: hypothetical protein A3D47_00280 [Candidatus Colwellbacteria bacterium RIFCSPHIGHO2_02_FULL_43_15]OGY58922.1 MAG: hypothetical protein A3E61_01495 [Candidatus Colwellbacteria bacterium RIFCSPHIGHO2_12_FULL_43_12]OGY61370.1 MAG: hypothetical protein A3F99_01040 [Candidatus Colwellbacteria bacterium RIFCSPLOWO2_12_FULL_43_11]